MKHHDNKFSILLTHVPSMITIMHIFCILSGDRLWPNTGSKLCQQIQLGRLLILCGLVCPQRICHGCPAVQSQTAVSAYFTSKKILPFGFAEQCYGSVRSALVQR